MMYYAQIQSVVNVPKCSAKTLTLRKYIDIESKLKTL